MGCNKDRNDCKKKHVCACCWKRGYILWSYKDLIEEWEKSDANSMSNHMSNFDRGNNSTSQNCTGDQARDGMSYLLTH